MSTDAAAALLWTYPAAFLAASARRGTVGGGGAVEFSGTPGATSAALTGGAPNETVHLVARGIPPTANRSMSIHLNGA